MAVERELQNKDKTRFPRLKGINQMRMREVVRDAELLYDIATQEYEPSVTKVLRQDCSTASFVFAKYIQKKLKIKAEVRLGLYLGYNPEVEQTVSKKRQLKHIKE